MTVLSIYIALGLFLVIFIFLRIRKVNKSIVIKRKSLEYLESIIKARTIDILKEADFFAKSDEEYISAKRMQKRYEEATRRCVDGNLSARNVVIAMYRSILEKELQTFDDVCEIINFRHPRTLPSMIKFEILLYKMSREHGSKIMRYLINKYKDMTKLRVIEEDGFEPFERREFDADMLDYIFDEELPDLNMTYVDGIQVLAILLYQRLKGFGCVDTLITLSIDGLEIGTSGTLRAEIDHKIDARYKMTNSVWIQAGSPWFHLSFLDLVNVGEMRRVINQFISYGNMPSLNEANPTTVNEMWDGSRVVGVRPSVGECWGVFIRKFSVETPTLEWWLDKGKTTINWELVRDHTRGLMRSDENIAFTGGQNTGKTTYMKAAMYYLFDKNIRVIEKSFETHLRELYPWMNSFTMKPTFARTSSDLQDLMKKTDSVISIVGEVADDESASRMIQFGKVGSSRTFWSSHHKTDTALVTGLADSLVATGDFKDYESAIAAVLEVVKINVHMAKLNGERVVAYISEITEIPRLQDYPEVKDSKNLVSAIDQITKLNREYYQRSTDRARFKSRVIIRYNPDTYSYEPVEWYTPETDRRILDSMSKPEYKTEWIAHYQEYWGSKKGV